MDVDVTLRNAEVVALLAEVAPIRIHLTEGDEDRKFVDLERPSEVSFAAGRGVRIVTRGRVQHELAGVGLPFDIRHVQLLFAPAVVAGHRGPRLDFRIVIEKGDLENVPGLVEGVVISRVNQALEPARSRMYWDVAQTLALSVPIPERFEPLDRFLTTARSVQMTVTHDALILRLSLELSMSRTRERAIDGMSASAGNTGRRGTA